MARAVESSNENRRLRFPQVAEIRLYLTQLLALLLRCIHLHSTFRSLLAAPDWASTLIAGLLAVIEPLNHLSETRSTSCSPALVVLLTKLSGIVLPEISPADACFSNQDNTLSALPGKDLVARLLSTIGGLECPLHLQALPIASLLDVESAALTIVSLAAEDVAEAKQDSSDVDSDDSGISSTGTEVKHGKCDAKDRDVKTPSKCPKCSGCGALMAKSCKGSNSWNCGMCKTKNDDLGLGQVPERWYCDDCDQSICFACCDKSGSVVKGGSDALSLYLEAPRFKVALRNQGANRSVRVALVQLCRSLLDAQRKKNSSISPLNYSQEWSKLLEQAVMSLTSQSLEAFRTDSASEAKEQFSSLSGALAALAVILSLPC